MPSIDFDSLSEGEPLDLLAVTAENVLPAPARLVPNQFPTIPPTSYRIALIGEAPGSDEENALKPFVGMSGRFLDQLLSKLSIARACCFVGNVCQQRPPANDITKFDFGGTEITCGLHQLEVDLSSFNPNLCVLLGKTALLAAKGTKNLGDWRGSMFIGTHGPFVGRKCLSTYHPAFCLRQYDTTPLLTFDLRRARHEGTFPDLRLPKRNIRINLTFEETIHALTEIQQTKPLLSLDIEGGVSNMSCIGIATSPSNAFIVPFTKLDGSSYWSIDEETSVWYLLASILCDRQINKVWQNGLYDRFVLQYAHDIVVQGNVDDTMLKFWELYCELEKSLGFQCSILTNEPFYKMDRKSQDQDTFYTYCCKDACVTYEINQKLSPLLEDGQRNHYQFNNEVLHFLLYAELRGIRYNEPLAQVRLEEMQRQVLLAQEKLDGIARGMGALSGIDYEKTNEEILAQVQEICCYKRDKTQPKKSFIEDGYWDIYRRLHDANQLSCTERGQISKLTGTTLNTKSFKFKDFLYGTCGLPTQYKKDPSTKEMRVTTDYEALLKLTKTHNHPALAVSLDLSLFRTRQQLLSIRSIRDRMHCSYNLVGSETGRISSSKSMIYATPSKRVGFNMQTIPDDWEVFDEDHPVYQGMRDLYIADEGCYLFKCDLKGADGWTVGAYMAMLGDSTMLDDLKFGLKPAQIVAYILKHGASLIEQYAQNRPKLKEIVSEIKKDDWEYFVSKQGIWGTCYTMGPRKLAERVFIESEGKVNLSEKQARKFQAAIYVRYRVKLWHNWMQRHLDAQHYPAKLVSPNGQVRKFFGRKNEILGEALAHLPQMVTTYATKKAAYRLWTDVDNRIPISTSRTGCSLRVEPLHQVHDELLCQAKIEDTAWAINKLKSYFDNPITVANQTITIPFDGAYGTAWSMDANHKIGETSF
jgi:uracil-DNA glycosylase family 4